MEENWGIIGHQKIVQFFRKSIEIDRLAQTYLFYGQKSLGKATLAEKFAEKLLGGEAAKAADLFKVELEDGKKNITIEQVREWRRFLQLKAFHQGYKVGIIYEAEKLNSESGNALLKIIEEPAPKTVIILITSSWDRILPTIISRSQLIRFSLVNKEEIKKGLALKNYPAAAIEDIIGFIGGYPGLAVAFLEKREAFKEQQQLERQVLKILESNVAERFLAVEKLFADVAEFNKKSGLALDFLKHIQKIFRDLLLKSYNLDVWRQNQKLSIEKNYSLPKIYDCLLKIQEAENLLLHNVQPRLVLENLFLYF